MPVPATCWTGPGAILNSNNSVNGPGTGATSPATRGDTVVVYLTGEGQTSPAGVTGKVTTVSSTPPLTPGPLLPISVTVGGQPASWNFAGEAPGFVSGVLQLKKGVKGGAFVREGDPQIVTQSLHDLMNLGHVSLSALREARIVLTDSVLKMACVRGTKEDFDAIEHSIDLSERLETYGDFNERVIAGTDFFRLIAVAAHNEVLTVLVDSLTAIVRHVVTQVHPPTTAPFHLVDNQRREILHQ